MLDLIVLSLADRLVEAPRPVSGRDYVPKPDPPLGEPGEPLVVRQRRQLLADCASDQPPELVGWMRIIALRRQRRIAWQAPEHEQPRVGPCDRRQAEFDAHRETPTALARAAQGPPHRPVFGQLQLRPRRRQSGAQPPRRLPIAPGGESARLLADG